MTEHNSTPQTPNFTPAGWEGRAHYRWVDEDGEVVRVERYPMEQEVHTALRLARRAHQQLRYYRADWAWTDVAKSPVAWHDLPESHGAGSEEPVKLLGFAVDVALPGKDPAWRTWLLGDGSPLEVCWGLAVACQRGYTHREVGPICAVLSDGTRPEASCIQTPHGLHYCRRADLPALLGPGLLTPELLAGQPVWINSASVAPGYVTSPVDDEPTPIHLGPGKVRFGEPGKWHPTAGGTLVVGTAGPEQIDPEAFTKARDLWPDGSTGDTGPDLQNPTETTLAATFKASFSRDLHVLLMGDYPTRGNEPDPVDPPEDPPSWAEAWRNAVKPSTTVTPAVGVDKFPLVLVTNGDAPMIIIQCNENRSDYIEAASVMAIRWEKADDDTVTVTVETESRDVQPNLRCFGMPAGRRQQFIDALDHAVVWGTK